MSGFLARLGAQAFGVASAVTPRRPARFAPAEGPVGDIAAEPVDAIEPPFDRPIERPPDTAGRILAHPPTPARNPDPAEGPGREPRSASMDPLSAVLPRPPILAPIVAGPQARGGVLDGSGSVGRVAHAPLAVEQRDSAPRRNPVRVLTKGVADPAEVATASARVVHDEAAAGEPARRHPLQPRQTTGTPGSTVSPPRANEQNAAAGLAEDVAPIVEVHIGRIDVVAEATAPPTRAQARARGIPTLAEYLANPRQR